MINTKKEGRKGKSSDELYIREKHYARKARGTWNGKKEKSVGIKKRKGGEGDAEE